MKELHLMDVKHANLEGLIVEETPGSLLVTAKPTLYIPEQKIILMDQAIDRECKILQAVPHAKVSLFV